MFKKKCKCGEIEKNFKFDIGPFFIGECCLEAGYDELGRKAESEEKPVEEVKSEPEEKKMSKSDLSGMKVSDLKAMAKEKGIEGADSMKKKELMKVLLG